MKEKVSELIKKPYFVPVFIFMLGFTVFGTVAMAKLDLFSASGRKENLEEEENELFLGSDEPGMEEVQGVDDEELKVTPTVAVKNPTSTPTAKPKATNTPIPKPTNTPNPTPTNTPQPEATATYTPTPTSSVTPTDSPTNTPTPTLESTSE